MRQSRHGTSSGAVAASTAAGESLQAADRTFAADRPTFLPRTADSPVRHGGFFFERNPRGSHETAPARFDAGPADENDR